MIKRTLQELCLNITDGKHGDCENEENSGYYFISCKDIFDGQINYKNARQITKADFEETHKRTMLEVDDILLTNSGTIGRMAFVTDREATTKTTFQKSVAIIKPDKQNVLPRYLYYQLQNCVPQFINSSNGSAQKNLLLSTMRTFQIEIEENREKQEKIANTLSAYDDLIENNQKQIKLLEEAAQRLYKEWFVDLRFPGHENTKIVDGVPEGWSIYPFSSKVDIMSGGTPKTSIPDYYNGKIPFYTPKDNDGAFFAYKTQMNITEGGLKNCNSRLYPPKTVIITARGTVGKTTILAVPMAMNQSCYALKMKENDAPYYLFFALDNEIKALQTMANGGVFNTIIGKTFDSINIQIPKDPLIYGFEETVRPFMEQIKNKLQANSKLVEARDRLLPKLMSGEVKV